MNPYTIADENPNEHFGVRACSFAGQQKSPDCGGKWFVVPTQQVRVANPLAPYLTVCANHLAVAADLTKPKRARRSPAKREEELSL